MHKNKHKHGQYKYTTQKAHGDLGLYELKNTTGRKEILYRLI